MNDSDTRPRIFIVDDHDFAREGVKVFLGDAFRIVGEADNTQDAIELIREREPDLAVVDVRLPGGGGDVVVAEVRRTHPDVKFLALSASTSRTDVVKLLDAGVNGYMTKATVGVELPGFVDDALDGQLPISADVAGYMLDIDESSADRSGLERLTAREREVVLLIARGYTYREVASSLGIAVKTLESHMHNIFRKLEVASRHELAALTYESGFVRPEDEPDASGPSLPDAGTLDPGMGPPPRG
jgi:DNA-binding NarL/FixJ family response regulator